MPLPIPETCGKWTCEHDTPEKMCGPGSRDHRMWDCQQPRGRCELHDSFIYGDDGKPVFLFKSEHIVKADPLPTDDVLALVTQQRDRAVVLLRRYVALAVADKWNNSLDTDIRKFLESLK